MKADTPSRVTGLRATDLALDLAIAVSTMAIIFLMVPGYFSWKSDCVATFGLEPIGCVGVLGGMSIALVIAQTLARYLVPTRWQRLSVQFSLLAGFFLIAMNVG